MKTRQLLIVCVVALVAWGIVSQMGESGLQLLWMAWVLFIAFTWGRCLYLWLFYKRAKGKFSEWVPLRPGAKRLYPEYGFEVEGARHSLVNRQHMRGDEPWPMTVLYHPQKPHKALFLTFREFLGWPLLQTFIFMCQTAVMLSQSGGWSGLWAKLSALV